MAEIEEVIRLAGTGMPPALIKYWTAGAGAAKIGWGVGGDFNRCRVEIQAEVSEKGKPLPPNVIDGLCATLHKIATGFSPGHAPGESAGHRADTERSIMTNKASSEEIPTPAELAPRPFTRSYPLEDIAIRASGDGRTVEAYAAVFNTPTEIHDQEGHYMEELDRSVFNRAISDSAPQGGRNNWKVGVFYNHGMTLMGTPSDRHSMPVGVPVDIRVEERGLLTVTRYNRSELADEILENIREGSISGYSFSGAFRRSSPIRPRGGWRGDTAGNLPTVRRMESTLREYGPTPFPAYQTAAVVGMRAAQLLANLPPDEYEQLAQLFRSGAPSLDSPESGAPTADDYAAAAKELATEDSLPPERSGRSVKGQMRMNRSAWLQRHGGKPHE